MTKQEAIDVLVAYACCILPKYVDRAGCNICHASGYKCGWDEDDIAEAILTLRDDKDINLGSKESDEE